VYEPQRLSFGFDGRFLGGEHSRECFPGGEEQAENHPRTAGEYTAETSSSYLHVVFTLRMNSLSGAAEQRGHLRSIAPRQRQLHTWGQSLQSTRIFIASFPPVVF